MSDEVLNAKGDKAAALKSLKRIMRKYGQPRNVVTDGLCSYLAAMKQQESCGGLTDREQT